MKLVLDTHVLLWWTSDPRQLSRPAVKALRAADEPTVAAVTWHELAWLAERGRFVLDRPLRSWLEELGAHVLTAPLTPAVAATAAALPASFPSDPADRLIYATAIETGSRLVTKDRRLREHRHARPVTLW
ncbi:MAG TPA: type II toxin-antitoxin system VapC family toxin [Gaiellaceae bacterium]|nr:type II toxin-antitoxin system VapC family toxin [Gaiellaceae bacterium]